MYRVNLLDEVAHARGFAVRGLRSAGPVLLGAAAMLVTSQAALALPPPEATVVVAPNSAAGSGLGPGTYVHIINGLINMPGQGGAQSFNVGQSGSGPSSASLGEVEACNVEQCGVPENWNVWLNSRVIGAYDSLAQTNGSGFIGMAGGDYKVLPNLALGLSLAVESFQVGFTGFNGRIRTTGFSAAPYASVKINDNIVASALVGLSTITYNTNLATNLSAQYSALRVFLGGTVNGSWYNGPWHLQAKLSGAYGSERQETYSDSAGNSVAGQTISYGSLAAGPEIGYAFTGIKDLTTLEPFVNIGAKLNFSSDTMGQISGATPLVVRSGTYGMGTIGAGVVAKLENGFSLRLEGSYESIGVSGLDVWSGQLRAALKF